MSDVDCMHCKVSKGGLKAKLVLYSKYHAPELHMATVLLVQPYQLSETIFQLQSLKQTVCLHSVVDSRHICLLLLLKTVVNCNVASASVSLHTFSFMALYKFVINFNLQGGLESTGWSVCV